MIGYTKALKKKKLGVRDSASAAPAGDDRPSGENLEKPGPLGLRKWVSCHLWLGGFGLSKESAVAAQDQFWQLKLEPLGF